MFYQKTITFIIKLKETSNKFKNGFQEGIIVTATICLYKHKNYLSKNTILVNTLFIKRKGWWIISGIG